MNLLFDSFNIPNLDQDYELNQYAYFLYEDCLVPQLFKPIKHIIKCHIVDQIDELDFFIYPINLCDPEVQSLNDSGKFFYDIDDRVLDKVKNSKGVILIDATYEPIDTKKNLNLKYQIEKIFGTNNVFINTKISSLYSNDNFFTNFPSFLEFHDTNVTFAEEIKVTTPKKFCLFGSRIDKHMGGLKLIKWLKEKNLIFQGHISLSRDNEDVDSTNYIRPFIDMDVLNYVKFNIVVAPYFDYPMCDFPMVCEKIFRNIHYSKPFILVGQFDTLAEFKRLGYQTFNELFDESYDTEKDSDTRLQKVFTQIQQLIDKPNDFWQKHKNKLDDIHKHNLDNYENRTSKLQKFYEEIRPR